MPERNEATKKPSSHEHDAAGPLSHDVGNAEHARYSKPAPEEADRIVASKLGPSGAAGQPWVDVGAVGPQKVDVGDQEIGSQTFHEAIVWNTETVEANVSARVDGNPAIQLISAPDRIFPSRDGVDPSNKIRLVFSPTAKGRVSGTLRVDLSWRAGARAPTQLVIPIEGAAHAPGSQTLAEEQAAQRQREQQQGDAAERDAQQKRREARDDEDWKTHRTHGDQQSRDALDTATAGAQIALHSLFENRRTGVDVAWEDAKQYVMRCLDFNDQNVDRIFKETHDLAVWVVNQDELLDRRLLEARNVKVIRYVQSATHGRNLIISSDARETLLVNTLKEKLSALLPSETSVQVIAALCKQFIDDANKISGGLVLKAARRANNTNELLGMVLSRYLVQSELGPNRPIAWCFLDDYSEWLGKKEGANIADLLVLAPTVDAKGGLHLDVIVTEAKFITNDTLANAVGNSAKQLVDTLSQLVEAGSCGPGATPRRR